MFRKTKNWTFTTPVSSSAALQCVRDEAAKLKWPCRDLGSSALEIAVPKYGPHERWGGEVTVASHEMAEDRVPPCSPS